MEKVTVDLDDLRRRGFNDEQLAVIRSASSKSTFGFAMQFLLGVAIAGFLGGAALLDTQMTYFPIWATAFILAGIGLRYAGPPTLREIAHTSAVMGTLALSIYIYMKGVGDRDQVESVKHMFAGIAALNFVVAAIMVNRPLIAIAVLATTPLLNMASAYGHASYGLFLGEPYLTVICYGVLAVVAVLIAKNTRDPFSGMSLVAFGTALFLVNLGFWVGSLWGDRASGLSSSAFALVWAVACIGALAWAMWENKRSVVSLSGIFLTINVYTQWYERLIYHPGELFVASGIGIALVISLILYNNGIFRFALIDRE